MKIELIDPLDPAPPFAIDYIVRFHWFGDENTRRQTTFAGLSGPLQYMQPSGTFIGPFNPGMTPVDLGATIGNLIFGATVVNEGSLTHQVKIRGLGASNTTVDTNGLNNSGVLIGLGSGNVDGYFAGVNTSKAEDVMANYDLTESASVPLFGGPESGANVLNADGTVHTAPYSERLVWTDSSWGGVGHSGTRLMLIQAAWAAAQNPALPSNDRILLARINPPQGSGDYNPVGISLASFVEMHRPAGMIPSNWVASDARITVTETIGETVLTVHEEGAYIERTFAGTQTWRNHVGLGTGGTGHVDFGIEDYEVYRHNYWSSSGDDVWAWGTYAWLGYEIEGAGATAFPDHELTLMAAGVHLAITDTHETSLVDRTANYVADLTAYNATYSVPVQEGTKTGRVDLLFPAETQPFYHGRVDALRMSGFKVGTYRIKKLRLEATGQAYLKICWGKQQQRSDYSSLVAAVNGAFVFGNWPDQAYKPDETGDYGGGIRYINPLTGSGSGLILDTHKSLEEFVLLLNKIEGWTATYSDAVHDARMKDAQGKEIADLAQFLLPVVPYQRLTPGDTFSPDCAIVCGQVEIPNATPVTLPWFLHLWGSLEGQGKTGGRRADSGVAVEAYRLDTGATVATGVTDEDGFAVVSPVPANGSVLVSLREAT